MGSWEDKEMPPGTPPPKHNDRPPNDREDRRRLNTPENATRAVATSRACINCLVPGRVWRHRAPHREVEIKASLMLDDSAVIVLHFSPEDGSILPKGLH